MSKFRTSDSKRHKNCTDSNSAKEEWNILRTEIIKSCRRNIRLEKKCWND